MAGLTLHNGIESIDGGTGSDSNDTPGVFDLVDFTAFPYGVVGCRSLYLGMPGYHCTPGNNVNTANGQQFGLTASV